MATTNPSFLRFLIDALRQRTLSPSPEGFEMDTRAAPGGVQQLTEQELLQQGRARRRGMLDQ